MEEHTSGYPISDGQLWIHTFKYIYTDWAGGTYVLWIYMYMD